MERTVLSTQDLAAIFGVNVSTVKRWADSGQLACIKTPGGHRRFRMNDVHVFLNDRGTSLKSVFDIPTQTGHQQLDTAIREQDWDWLQDHVASSAIAGTTQDIVTIFNAMYANGVHPAMQCDFVVSGALEKVGIAWEENTISVADEHLATHAIRYALDEIGVRWSPLREAPFTALCASFARELHEMACECVRRVLQHEGWDVIVLGADTPTDSIISAIERHRPHLVAISVTMPPDVAVFSADMKRIAESAEVYGGRTIVGGQAIVGSVRRSLPKNVEPIADMDMLVDYALDRFGEHVMARSGR